MRMMTTTMIIMLNDYYHVNDEYQDNHSDNSNIADLKIPDSKDDAEVDDDNHHYDDDDDNDGNDDDDVDVEFVVDHDNCRPRPTRQSRGRCQESANSLHKVKDVVIALCISKICFWEYKHVYVYLIAKHNFII